MVFVGHVFVPPPTASERARRLSAELQKTIVEFQRRDPGVNEADIRQALLLATPSAAIARPARLLVAAAGVAIALAVGLLMSGRRTPTAQIPWAPLAVLAVAAAVGVTLYLRRRE